MLMRFITLPVRDLSQPQLNDSKHWERSEQDRWTLLEECLQETLRADQNNCKIYIYFL